MASSGVKLKLYFFNLMGRGELSRLILAHAGQEYEDIRLSQEEWIKLKPETPYGILPYININGDYISGSIVVARFLAEKYGLAGKDAIENSKLASFGECVEDIFKHIPPFINTAYPEIEQQASKEYISGSEYPSRLRKLESRIKDGHIEGIAGKDGANWGDIAALHIVTFVKLTNSNMMNGFPKLLQLVDDVAKLPRIAKWITERPKTVY